MSDPKKPEPYGEEVVEALKKAIGPRREEIDKKLKEADDMVEEMIRRSKSQPKKEE